MVSPNLHPFHPGTFHQPPPFVFPRWLRKRVLPPSPCCILEVPAPELSAAPFRHLNFVCPAVCSCPFLSLYSHCSYMTRSRYPLLPTRMTASTSNYLLVLTLMSLLSHLVRCLASSYKRVPGYRNLHRTPRIRTTNTFGGNIFGKSMLRFLIAGPKQSLLRPYKSDAV